MQTSTPNVYAVAAITPHSEDLFDFKGVRLSKFDCMFNPVLVGERQDADQHSRRLCRRRNNPSL
jgi:hypothetical protein